MKRAIDVVLGGTALALAAPLLLVAAAAITAETGLPIVFVQERAGRKGVPFRLLKLRTMHHNEVPPVALGQVGSDHDLVTGVGKILRRFKIDELPQLINVIRGELSLVGPRPALVEQVEHYDSFEMKRLSVKPGMTGWSQINGNTALPWETRILLDVWYIDHHSIWLDLAIIGRTVGALLRGEEINDSAIVEAKAYANSAYRGG